MEPTFTVELTGAEIESLLRALDLFDDDDDAPEDMASAQEKLMNAFTIVESAGGC
jgi:hypothetical protein